MNIIEFLIDDHDRLRRDCVEIKRNLADGIFLRNKIKKYIADMELHESIEFRFLITKLNRMDLDSRLSALIITHEEQHEKIWALIEELVQAVSARHLPAIQKIFFDFYDFVESHIRLEERVIFPGIEESIEEKTLEEWGEIAERYYKRFNVETVGG